MILFWTQLFIFSSSKAWHHWSLILFFKIHCIYSIILWSPRYVGMNENHYHDKYFWKSILQFLHRSCEATFCLMLVLKCFVRTVNTYLHQLNIWFKRTLIYYLLLHIFEWNRLLFFFQTNLFGIRFMYKSSQNFYKHTFI